MDNNQIKDLLLQSLEHEIGGIQVYETALRCVINEDLKKEWNKYLDETRNHEKVLRELCETMSFDADEEVPSREIIRTNGHAFVKAMEMALKAGKLEAAQIVACECVVLAETKDHFNWELIGMVGKKLKGEQGKALREAHDEIEDQEDEHLYHTKGWCRELWIEALGLPAVLPPPEEERDVKTAIGAARAEQAREKML